MQKLVLWQSGLERLLASWEQGKVVQIPEIPELPFSNLESRGRADLYTVVNRHPRECPETSRFTRVVRLGFTG